MSSIKIYPSPGTRSFREKLQSALFHIAFTGLASYALFVPPAASAAFFSLSNILGSTAKTTSAASSNFNSQTLPLLAPAVNLDPTPAMGGGDISVVDGSALLPQDGPDGTQADLLDKSTSSTISVYAVHPGDTLSEIAQMFDVSVNTIKWANDLKNGVIHEGQVLVILPITGVRYTVQKGDTLASVAKKYKADEDEIAQYNLLEQGASLAVGDEILIPDGEVVAPVVRTTSSTPTAPLRGAGGPVLGIYAWPVAGGILTQGLHGYNGIDIGAPVGTSIFASAAGTVIIARDGGYNGGYGSYVVIQHDNGTQTLYAHMSKVLVSAGVRVGQGATIGLVGRSGKSTGYHLHFEVRGAANPFSR